MSQVQCAHACPQTRVQRLGINESFMKVQLIGGIRIKHPWHTHLCVFWSTCLQGHTEQMKAGDGFLSQKSLRTRKLKSGAIPLRKYLMGAGAGSFPKNSHYSCTPGESTNQPAPTHLSGKANPQCPIYLTSPLREKGFINYYKGSTLLGKALTCLFRKHAYIKKFIIPDDFSQVLSSIGRIFESKPKFAIKITTKFTSVSSKTMNCPSP